MGAKIMPFCNLVNHYLHGKQDQRPKINNLHLFIVLTGCLIADLML
jgi:hypothetical protein